MKILRLGASGLSGALVIGFVGLVLLPWIGGPALFGADFSELLNRWMEEQARGQALDERDGAVLRSLTGKGEVVAELISGKLTLEEATDRFERICGMVDDSHDDTLGQYRKAAKSRQEMYDHVIRWVEVSLQASPKQQKALVGRLARERDRLLAGAATAPQ